jgi:putative addiction module killer protein
MSNLLAAVFLNIYKIDFGPGYRVYFGQDKNVLIILLTGGIKKSQSKDIEKAKMYWQEYSYSKKQGG